MDGLTVFSATTFILAASAGASVAALLRKVNELEKRLAWQESLLIEVGRASGLGTRQFGGGAG